MKEHSHLHSVLPLVLFAALGAAAAAVWTAPVAAQSGEGRQKTQTVRIVLKDGSVFIGTIVSRDSTTIVLRTPAGARVVVPVRAVSHLEAAGGSELRGSADAGLALPPESEEKPVSPETESVGLPSRDDVRLFLMPTAKTLPRGSAYLGVYELFFPHVVAGITDWLTLGGGITMFPFGGAQFVFVAPKIGLVRKPRFHVAVGGLWTLVGLEAPLRSLYVVATGDWSRSSLTLGAVGFLQQEGFALEKPLLVVGWQVRASASSMFVAENYVDPEKRRFWPGLGVRFCGRRVSGDLAFHFRFDEGRLYFLPWIGFTYSAE